MNEQERAELEQFKQRQALLLEQLADLGRKVQAFEARLTEPKPAIHLNPVHPETPKLPPTESSVAGTPPKPLVPPPIPVHQPPHLGPVPAPVVAQTTAPTPPVRPILSPAAIKIEPARPQASAKVSASAPQHAPLPPKAVAASTKKEGGSFEMRLGTFWLVRIGIVMLLTGLVFFGTYAYENYVVHFNAAGKVALLYLASGALLGVGTWLQRGQESLKNYAQVLSAGGMAAVYFTTYAAHHVANLLVIRSAMLDGALLLGWAGFIAWQADRKKSEIMAFFAVLLAYFSSIITHVGPFTLYSNLVLTLAAVFFLVRNRWATLSFASLIATYAGYCFWRFYQDGEWAWVSPGQGLWSGTYFLMAYWAVFTAAVFLSQHEQFTGPRRSAFLSLNNGAFFTTFILTMWQVRQGGFWKFALMYGTLLLALAFLARQFLPKEKLARNSYLTQGVLLVTLGFLTHYSGLKLSLVLAAESIILVITGQQMKSRVLQVGSVFAAFLAALWSLHVLEPFDHNGLLMGSAVGAAMLLNALLLRRETTFAESASHARTIIFTCLGLIVWLFTTWQNTRPEWRGLALACECVVFLVAARPAGNRMLHFGAYAFAAVASGWQILALSDQFGSVAIGLRIGWLQASAVGALMIVGALWDRRLSAAKPGDNFHPGVSLFSVLSLFTWLATTWAFTRPEWLAPALAIEAAAFTGACYLLQLKEITLFGQGFLLLSQALWLYDATAEHVIRPWWNPTIVIVFTLGLASWWQRQKTLVLKQPVSIWLQGVFALAIVGLLYFWLEPHFNAPDWLAFTSLLAVVLTAYAALNRFWLLAAAGQIFLIVSSVQFGRQLWDTKPEWYFALAPIATLALLSFCALKWFEHRPEAKTEIREPILRLGQAYRIVALVMSLWWVYKYIPARENCWVLALAGVLLFLLAGWRRNQELLLFGAVFTLSSLGRFWLPIENAPTVYLPNLLAILLVLAQQRVAKRQAGKYAVPAEIHGATIALGSLSLWTFLSRWILENSTEGVYLTAGWSALALVLFIAGMAFRERVYRWLGLAVLTCALGRVTIVDVWKLDTIYRVLSFMALGIVLLLLGFLYTKYQEKIRQWL